MTVCYFTDMTGGFTHLGKAFETVADDVSLMRGGELLIYIKDPDNVQIDDIGTTLSISVHTNNAQYITETNVESATTQ